MTENNAMNNAIVGGLKSGAASAGNAMKDGVKNFDGNKNAKRFGAMLDGIGAHNPDAEDKANADDLEKQGFLGNMQDKIETGEVGPATDSTRRHYIMWVYGIIMV